MYIFEAGKVIKSAEINANFAEPTYVDWTPTFTNLTLGTSSITAKYAKIGKIVQYTIIIDLKSGFSITGAVSYTLPVAGDSIGTFYTSGQGYMCGMAKFQDTSLSRYHIGYVSFSSNNTSHLLQTSNINASDYAYTQNLSSSIPFTWVATDKIYISAMYRSI